MSTKSLLLIVLAVLLSTQAAHADRPEVCNDPEKVDACMAVAESLVEEGTIDARLAAGDIYAYLYRRDGEQAKAPAQAFDLYFGVIKDEPGNGPARVGLALNFLTNDELEAGLYWAWQATVAAPNYPYGHMVLATAWRHIDHQSIRNNRVQALLNYLETSLVFSDKDPYSKLSVVAGVRRELGELDAEQKFESLRDMVMREIPVEEIAAEYLSKALEETAQPSEEPAYHLGYLCAGGFMVIDGGETCLRGLKTVLEKHPSFAREKRFASLLPHIDGYLDVFTEHPFQPLREYLKDEIRKLGLSD